MRRRLDAELVRRGLATSRTSAKQAIEAGLVTIAGRPAIRPSSLVLDDEPIVIEGEARRFVSRGGEKLDAAMEAFGLRVDGESCLDAGASTGGFTDCLLRRGAERVLAVDVGYGQLDWVLRNDPRVTVLERTNVRSLQAEDLPCVPSFAVADLSFISLRSVIPALKRVCAADPRWVLLVKPQFEVGRGKVGKGGVVRDRADRAGAIRGVAAACREQGMVPVRVMRAPLLGPAGNVEFLLYASATGTPELFDPDAATEERT
jgi:23S rRNA (cytidine1920-2'-O)/16S rRNA (cytidine1409-2'-O)-methyltransferase